MDASHSCYNDMDGNQLKLNRAKFNGIAIIRDQYGRIVVDEAIFFDDDKLTRLKDEVRKNGSYSLGSDPKRDC